MGVQKQVVKFAKKTIRKWLDDGPARDEILLVQDSKDAAGPAVMGLARYLDTLGRHVSIFDASDYSKHRRELFAHRAIIVGHHDLAKEELENVNVQDLGFGLYLGTSKNLCVLRASRKALGKHKAAFAAWYDEKMDRWPEFTRDYAVPARFGTRNETRKSQYDLLWILFAREALPAFLEQGDSDNGEAEAPAPERTGGDPERLTGQFLREAPEAEDLTGAFLADFCAAQLPFAAPAGDREPHAGPGALLLSREGWQVRRGADGTVSILDPDGTRRAWGTADQLLSPLLSQLHARGKIRRLKAEGRLEYGVVFSGGGAKGAFQLGVWRWLEEHGGIDRFTGLSGASVGAMNVLLFAQGDYARAERVWSGIRQEDLMSANQTLSENLGRLLSGPSKSFSPEEMAEAFLSGLSENAGLFSKEALRAILLENISLKALEGRLACVSLSALTTSNLRDVRNLTSFLAPVYAYLDTEREDPLEPIIRRVLASAALPGAYTPETVEGKLCIDGGVLDNHPVRPLLQAGYRKLLVIHLHPQKPDWTESVRQEGVELRRVWPLEDLGGTLEISAGLTRKRIAEGYRAAEFYLGGLG